jgi:FtsH-binding integral membrane protein
MKKPFIITSLFLALVMIVIIMNFRFLNPYNTDLFHPIFGALLPLTLLMFFSGFLKSIKYRSVLMTLVIFIAMEAIILSQVESVCSGIVCYDRTTSALILSSLFSIIYFIALLLKNKKQSTLVK